MTTFNGSQWLLLLASLVSPELSAEEAHFDYTAAQMNPLMERDRDRALAPDILSFQITADFPRARIVKSCLATLIRRIPHADRCEYTAVTAAHCLTFVIGPKLSEFELATKVQTQRFGGARTTLIEIHPQWRHLGNDLAAVRGVDLGFVRFSAGCGDGGTPVVSLWERPWAGFGQLVLASIKQGRLIPATGWEGQAIFPRSLELRPRERASEADWIRHGDSGGGCFVYREGRAYLAGVISHARDGRSYCTDPGAVSWLEREVLDGN